LDWRVLNRRNYGLENIWGNVDPGLMKGFHLWGNFLHTAKPVAPLLWDIGKRKGLSTRGGPWASYPKGGGVQEPEGRPSSLGPWESLTEKGYSQSEGKTCGEKKVFAAGRYKRF